MSPSPLQLLIVGLIIILLFGASRLGEVGKGLGDGIRNFKKGISGGDDDDEAEAKRLKDKQSDSSVAEAKADVVAEKKEKA